MTYVILVQWLILVCLECLNEHYLVWKMDCKFRRHVVHLSAGFCWWQHFTGSDMLCFPSFIIESSRLTLLQNWCFCETYANDYLFTKTSPFIKAIVLLIQYIQFNACVLVDKDHQFIKNTLFFAKDGPC